jgi:predicted nucleic acid-binding protein
LSGIRAFIDADCLHKLYLRTLLLTLSGSGDIHFLWTREVFEEARKSLVARFPEDSEKLRLKFDLIKTHFYGNEVKGHQWLIGTLGCRDLNDEHVLAGAIQGKADVLLTFNLRDFPKDSLQGLRVMHPDSFLSLWLEAKPKEGIQAISKWLARFENPPIEANLACLLVQKIDCPQLGVFIKKHRVEINRQIRAIRSS